MLKEFIAKHADVLKKLAAALLAAVAAYFILAYLVPHLLSVKVVSLAGAVALGYIVYTRLSISDLNKAIAQGQKAVDEVKKTVS